MTFRAKAALWAAGLFIVINLAGGVIAAVQGEFLHAGVHAALLVLGVYVTWRFGPQAAGAGTVAVPREIAENLTRLEQSVAAIGVEAERMAEGQRFITRLFTERTAPRPPEGE
ncbi:MAG: hypothetical protein ABI408_11885 [Gemmatimonadaceae bacterium]